MRGRVIAVLFLSFLVASSLHPQCSYQREYSGAYRTSYLDLAVAGGEMWAATGSGVQLFDRSVDPPALIGSISLPGVTRRIRVIDGVAYAATDNSVYAIRRNGRELQISETAQLSTQINDLEASGSLLVVATATGAFVFDTAVSKTTPRSTELAGKNIFSVAIIGGTVYAADGDTTIDRFELVSAPLQQPLTTTIRATSVNVADALLLASDGQQTEAFSGTTRLGSFAFGTVSVAPSTGGVVFVASNDRQLRAISLAVLENPVELFRAEISPSGGSINRVAAMTSAGTRLYVAGGDTGLSVFDTNGFGSPFQQLAYRAGIGTSVAADGSTFFLATTAGGITAFRRSTSNGTLQVERTWATDRTHVVHDAAGNFLLSSSGATLTYWTMPSGNPVSTATFRAVVRSAVLRGATAYALLDDGTLWSADLAQVTATPVQIANAGSGLSYLASDGTAIATASVSDTGATTVRFYATGNPDAPGETSNVNGATTTLAVSGSRVAVFTFAGISVIDFSSSASPQAVVLENSRSGGVVTDIAMTSATLTSVAGTTASIYDLATGRLRRTTVLPADATGVDLSGDNAVAVATSEGIVALNATADSRQPSRIATLGGNKYYRKAAAAVGRLYLFDGSSIDVFDTQFAGAPRFIASVAPPGTIDIAASDEFLFALANNGTLSQLTRAGEPVRTANANATADAIPLSVAAVGGAAWVSISTGCLSTGCEKRTLVFDPATLMQSATLSGGVIDVEVNGSRAAAIFDLPRETRTYNVADPLHPAGIATRASESGAAAIAIGSGSVLVTGDKLYAYNENTLDKTGEESRDAINVASDGGCTLVGTRASTIDLFAGAPRTAAGSVTVAGAIRSITGRDGRMFVLTDYSLETLSRVQPPKLNRRRAAQ